MAREMKNSGVEWIGSIPAEWEICRLKDIYTTSVAGEVIDKSFWNAGSELLYTCQRTPMLSNFPNFPERKRTGQNDLLLTRNATPYIFIPKSNSIYSNVVQKITLTDTAERRFVKYSLKQGADALTVNGDTIPSYNMGVWSNIRITLPPFEEQKKVADLLDDMCADIDMVIGKTKKTIDEYKKMKLTIITETVTKGIRSNRQTKDSGYEFIGTIPSDWDVCRLRNIGIPQNGISKGGEFFGTGFPFVSYGDVYKNYSLPTTVAGLVQSSDEERERYSVKTGDIFFTRTSETIDEVGFSCVCEQDIPNATFAGFLIRVRPFKDCLYTGYSKYYFRSNHHRGYLVKEMNLVTRASLGQDLLKSMPVLVPPMDEQKEIAAYLDEKCTEIDTLIAKKTALLEEMENYKKSVIYEYVTGKKQV